jgi:uncharacterized membrane protein
MNLKTKALGLFAGTALTLSLATGALAGTESSTAVLENSGNGVCSVSASSASFDFGTWVWNGSTYVPPAGNGNVENVNVTVTQTISSQPRNCDLTVSPGALTFNAQNIIQASNLTALANGAASNVATINTPTGAGSVVPVQVTLNDTAALDSLAPGTYTGNVTISVAQSAN